MLMDFLYGFADECLHQYYEIIPYFCQTALFESPWNGLYKAGENHNITKELIQSTEN